MVSEPHTIIQSLVESLKGLYDFVVIITRDSPIGLWSAIGAFVIPSLMGPKLKKWLPPSPSHPQLRALLMDLIMLGVAIAYAWLPWQTLQGMMVGIAGGLGSTTLWRGTSVVFGPLWLWVKRRLGVDDWKPYAHEDGEASANDSRGTKP